jgi:hypothetical protein
MSHDRVLIRLQLSVHSPPPTSDSRRAFRIATAAPATLGQFRELTQGCKFVPNGSTTASQLVRMDTRLGSFTQDVSMNSNEFRRWFRTIRFFERRGAWYFLAPDGLAVGPYISERAAETQAARLAKILKNLDAQRARVAVIEFTIEGHGLETVYARSRASLASAPHLGPAQARKRWKE